MKKIVYSLFIVIASVLSFASCTEEEVAPNTANGGGGDIIVVVK